MENVPTGGMLITLYFDHNAMGEGTGSAVRNKGDVMCDDSQILFFLGVRSAVEGRRREWEPGPPQLCECPFSESWLSNGMLVRKQGSRRESWAKLFAGRTVLNSVSSQQEIICLPVLEG